MKYVVLTIGIITLIYTLHVMLLHTIDISIVLPGTLSIVLIGYAQLLEWIDDQKEIRDLYKTFG
jgi:hypothetical protein